VHGVMALWVCGHSWAAGSRESLVLQAIQARGCSALPSHAAARVADSMESRFCACATSVRTRLSPSGQVQVRSHWPPCAQGEMELLGSA